MTQVRTRQDLFSELQKFEDKIASVEAAIVNAKRGFVTALPLNPYNGQECYFVAQQSASGRAIWHLRYALLNPDGTPNSSAYKWDVIGGGFMRAEVATNQATTSTTYVSLGGPSLTTPLAGDYVLEWGGNVAPNNNQGLMTPKIGAAAASDNDTFYVQATTNIWLAGMRSMRKVSLAANTVLEIQYRNSTTGNNSYMNRWFKLRPERVG